MIGIKNMIEENKRKEKLKVIRDLKNRTNIFSRHMSTNNFKRLTTEKTNLKSKGTKIKEEKEVVGLASIKINSKREMINIEVNKKKELKYFDNMFFS